MNHATTVNLLEVSGVSALVLAALHAVAAVVATPGRGAATRRWLLLALVTAWGLRLSWFIQRKTVGRGEDPRYAALLRNATPAQVARKVSIPQDLIGWFVSVPLQLSAVAGPTSGPLSAVSLLGLAVWLVRAARTRHPNHFGDAAIWWGLSITVNGWPALATVGSPLPKTHFLMHRTRARLTEKMMAGRPGFDQYGSRTAFFFPRPPRRAHR